LRSAKLVMAGFTLLPATPIAESGSIHGGCRPANKAIGRVVAISALLKATCHSEGLVISRTGSFTPFVYNF
jgi:hypothetical protein